MNKIQAEEKCMTWKRVRECVAAERMACVRPEAGRSPREEQPRSSRWGGSGQEERGCLGVPRPDPASAAQWGRGTTTGFLDEVR